MARLLALSALAVAASSAVGPAASGAGAADDATHAVAELHGAIDLDEDACGPAGPFPVLVALPPGAPRPAPARALGDAPSAPQAGGAAPARALLRLAPKTSPPARLAVASVR